MHVHADSSSGDNLVLPEPSVRSFRRDPVMTVKVVIRRGCLCR